VPVASRSRVAVVPASRITVCRRAGSTRADAPNLSGAERQSLHADDADTFFGVELPALTEWDFGADEAAAIGRPVLSVLGSRTEPLWVEVAAFLRSSLPNVEELTIDGVGHLLHAQRPEPVARGMADFLQRNAIARDEAPVSA
jgi:pimeloyl-ACP methyl ester carboxylesterase